MTSRQLHVFALTVLAIFGCAKARPDNTADVQRIVTLTPSATEIVFAVGLGKRVVGVDQYTNFPKEAAALPKVGDFMSPSFEAIMRLQPDLVVADAVQQKVVAALERAGIRTLTLPMHTIANLEVALLAVGEAAGARAEATRVVERAHTAIASHVKQSATDLRPRVLAVVDRHPQSLAGMVAAGPGSFADELITLIGARNALAASPVRYPKISAEQLRQADPDIILELAHTATRTTEAWSAMPTLRAVKEGRVHILVGRHFAAPSPRYPLAIEALAALVFPSVH